MPKTPEGLFRPWFLTRAGKAKLVQFRAAHPKIKPGRLLKAFQKESPECFKQSKFYHISYVCAAGCEMHPLGGKQHKESTGKRTLDEAKTVRDIKKGRAAEGKPDNGNEIKVSELLQGVLDYADIHCKRSTAREYADKVKHLGYFSAFRAIDLCINESIISRFIKKKLSPDDPEERKYSKASINGMLTVLELSFSLATNRLPMRPNIGKHKFKKLDNARKGHFKEKEYVTLCKHFPDDVRRPIEALNETGWRVMEILSRQRAHVLSDRIILEPEETKNSEGRFFPITATLRMILDEQEVVTKELEKREGRIIAWLFHHNGEPLAKHYEKRGYWKPTRYFLRAWNEACKAAGLVGRLRHDFRRTAVRRFDTLPDHVGMKLSGHKSHSVYLAYKATSESDIFEAAKKLDKEKIKRGHRKAGS